MHGVSRSSPMIRLGQCSYRDSRMESFTRCSRLPKSLGGARSMFTMTRIEW